MAAEDQLIARARDQFNNTSFGLELETCVHIIDDPLFTRLPMEVSDAKWKETLQEHTKKAVTAVYNCYKYRFPKIRWQLILDTGERATGYDRWIIMPDSSLECDYRPGASQGDGTLTEKYCVIRGHKFTGGRCQKYVFYPVEIVSPKLTGFVGLKYFTMMWHGVLMGDSMVYSVNETQGLHTNISNPNMNPAKFLKLWTQFEYVILQIIGEERRQTSITMATPLSYGLGTGFSLEELASQKFIAISLKKGNSPRLEVRIHSGTMDYTEIVNWTAFCMWMLCISIVIPEDRIGDAIEYPQYLQESDKTKLVTDFFSLIRDKRLIRFLQAEYNANKQADWPTVNYTGPSENIIRYTLPSDFDPTVIEKIRHRKCPPTKLTDLN